MDRADLAVEQWARERPDLRTLPMAIFGRLNEAADRVTREHDSEGRPVRQGARVDGGPMMKRIQPRARGTAYPIKRRYSHIHVTLSEPAEE